MKLCVYWHIFAVNQWRPIVAEQLMLLRHANVLSTEVLLSAFISGPGEEEAREFVRREGFRLRSQNPNEFEFPAITRLWEDAKLWEGSSEYAALYFNTKGVTHPGSEHQRRWRDILNNGVLLRIEEHLAALESGKFDVTGQNYLQTNDDPVSPHGYYSGNFWMVRSDYARRLPDPRGLDWSNRYHAEQWVCSIPHRPHAFPFIEPMEER